VDGKEVMEMIFAALEGRRGIERIQTFEDAGVRSNGLGVVVTTEGGAQFNVSMNQVRHAPSSAVRSITFNGEIKWRT
jgi:hypothetical protein